MKIKNLLLLLILVLPVSAQADPLFGKDMAGDRKLPRAFGVGIDYFSMDQPYQIDSLSFSPPPTFPLPPITNVNAIVVDSEIENVDLKVDVWLTGRYRSMSHWPQTPRHHHLPRSHVLQVPL